MAQQSLESSIAEALAILNRGVQDMLCFLPPKAAQLLRQGSHEGLWWRPEAKLPTEQDRSPTSTTSLQCQRLALRAGSYHHISPARGQ